MSTTTVTYLAAADVPANEAAVFPARGEAFPADGGWTFQSVIGQRSLLGEFDTEAAAQAACDAWLVQLTPADTAEIERKALAAAASEPDAKLTELRARMAARGDVTPFSEIQDAARAAVEPGTCLVLGAGKSSVRAIRDADQDEENWILARVLFARQMHETEHRPERWCVLVSGVTEDELDADHATIAHREIHDFDLALGAARGVNVREQSEIAAAKAAMSAAGAI